MSVEFSYLNAPDHLKRVERIARKHTRGSTIAWEDAAQVAHTKIFQALKAEKFRYGGVEKLYRWAATVARCAVIDFVRMEKRRTYTSLDQMIPGSDIPLLDTVADEFNALDMLERTDLVLRAIDAIATLDQRHPDRHYRKLWQGQVEGKKQTQLAAELGLNQGTVSKRWKELCQRIVEELELLQPDQMQLAPQTAQQQATLRQRSTLQW